MQTATNQNENPKMELIDIAPDLKITAESSALFDAMSKAQQEIGSLIRNKKGYGYDYADLANCLDCVKESMSKNGLNISQFPGYSVADGFASVTTVLSHASGQMLCSVMTVPIIPNKSNNDIQAYGSAITYARRYAITAIMNLAAEDDDGEAGKKFGELKGKSAPAAAKQAEATAPKAQSVAPKPQIVKQANTPLPQSTQNAAAQPKPIQNAAGPVCTKCGKKITERIKDFSLRRFNKCLCIDCQNEEAKPMAS